jgi:predicted nuclease with RNAse H fold
MGVDVGGIRKGFDVAVIDEAKVLELRARLTVAEVVALVEQLDPLIVGIDSPCCPASDGETSRACERQVAKEVCGIRWTPDAVRLQASPYYAWIVHGLELHCALAGITAEVIEVFPTASWTRWAGKRGRSPRSAWTRSALMTLGLRGIPARTNQDQRDAIAAAVTAREHTRGTTEAIGDIVVPSGMFVRPERA